MIDRPTWRRLAAPLFTVAACCFFFIVSAKTDALRLPTMHLDGAFQTASGLFRIDANQLPGRDFYPYLGIGPVFALYPIFKLAGSNLAASVVASHSVVLLALALSTSLLIYLLLPRDTRFRGSASLSAGFLIACAMFALQQYLPAWAIERLHPGHSLRPIRSAWPFAVAWVFYLAARRHDRYAPYVLLGLAAGLSTTWSNDFAIPSILATVIGAAGIARFRQHRFLRSATLFTACALLGSSIVLIATAGHIIPLLRYNFADVAADQWWYFAPWNEASRIFSLANIGRVFEPATWFGTALLAVLAWRALRRPTAELVSILLIGLTLFLGGALASIGGHLGGYFAPFAYWSYAIATIAVALKLLSSLRALGIVLTMLGMPLLASALGLAAWAKYQSEDQTISRNEQYFYVSELGGYLPMQWKAHVEAARLMPPGREVEEYWGLWSAMRKPHPMLPVDSVIHALGQTRVLAANVLSTLPDTVVSTRPSFSAWQGWSFSANYWFYKPLLKHYQIVDISPSTVTWRKSSTATQWEEVECSPNGSSIDLGPTTRGFYEVTIAYSIPAHGRQLAFLRNGIVQAEGAAGQLSLPIASQTATFPVFASGSGSAHYAATLRPERNGGAVTINSCSARAIRSSAIDTFVVPDSSLPLDDEIWSRGFSRREPKMVLELNQANYLAYVEGRTVSFATGTARRISRATADSNSLRLIVEFDGNPLDGGSVGYPNPLSVE